MPEAAPPNEAVESVARTPRLDVLLRAIEELDDHEMRHLPRLLGNKLRALDRLRATELREYIGARCDVIWPGEAEFFDVTLVSIDEQAALARVSLSRSGPEWSVPPYAVRID